MIDRRCILPILLFTAVVTAASAQEQSPPIDPLTGRPMVVEEEEAPAPPRADLSEARDLVRQGKYAEAVDVLAGLKPDFPDDPSLAFLFGEVLLASGDPEKALPELRRAAELAPDRERVQFQIGSACAALGQTDAALEAFGRELENTENAELVVPSRLNRAVLLQNKRDWAGSAAEFEAVLGLEPQRTEIYGELAALYAQAGDLATAEDALSRGAEAGFESSGHYYGLGARYYRVEDYDAAVRCLEKALEIDPTLSRAERSLAASLEKLGRDDDALEHLRRYLELEPDSPDREKILERLEKGSAPGQP